MQVAAVTPEGKSADLSAAGPVHGSHPCDKPGCDNLAYWAVGESVYCGVHSKSMDDRTARTKSKARRDGIFKARHREHLQLLLAAATANREAGVPGRLAMAKMRMMKEPKLQPGSLNLAPNNRAHGSVDAETLLELLDGEGEIESLVSASAPTLACNALSPMQLGPVQYEPDDPLTTVENGVTACIEADHQLRKVFPVELEKCDRTSILSHIMILLASGAPHRHKPLPGVCLVADEGPDSPITMLAEPKPKSKRRHPARLPNEPLYSLRPVPATSPRAAVWPDGKTYAEVTYLESRQFYCYHMERLAGVHPAFVRSLKLLRAGVNICIVGYDGWDTDSGDFDPIAAYQDTTRPFGHEAVLLTMFLKATGRFEAPYPWRTAVDPALWFSELMPPPAPKTE